MNSVMLRYQHKTTGQISEYSFEAHSPERAALIISESMKLGNADYTLVGLETA